MSDYPYDDEEEQCTDNANIKVLDDVAKMIDIQVPPEAMEKATKEAARAVTASIIGSIRASVESTVKKECGAIIVEQAKSLMPELFKEVIASKIVINEEKSWKQEQIEIRDLIKKQMDMSLAELRDGETRRRIISEAVKSFITKDVTKEVEAAVNEFRKGFYADLSKEAMKKVVKALVDNLGGDRKLLAALTCEE